MKRWMIYAAAAAAAVALKPGTKDVGNLIPVELLYISSEPGIIRAETDTGNMGVGENLDAALKNLEDTAPGTIFLETADYLIITENAAHLLPQLTQVLRPAAEVCIGIQADTQAAAYLKAHPPEVTMKDIKAGNVGIPILIKSEERYHIGEVWKPKQTE